MPLKALTEHHLSESHTHTHKNSGTTDKLATLACLARTQAKALRMVVKSNTRKKGER